MLTELFDLNEVPVGLQFVERPVDRGTGESSSFGESVDAAPEVFGGVFPEVGHLQSDRAGLGGESRSVDRVSPIGAGDVHVVPVRTGHLPNDAVAH